MIYKLLSQICGDNREIGFKSDSYLLGLFRGKFEYKKMDIFKYNRNSQDIARKKLKNATNGGDGNCNDYRN